MALATIPVAVIGTGRWGSAHARVYSELPQSELVAVSDTDEDRGREVARRFGAAFEKDLDKLLDRVKAVSISTPTSFHFDVALACLERGVHVLVEKPLARTLGEADRLIEVAHTRGLRLMVGHVERFNPAFMAVRPHIDAPRYIESMRVSPFSFRSQDVGVVMDMMIHDIDIILRLVQSPLVSVQAVGVEVLSRSEDIANARLEFQSGCVANVTASRVSFKSRRRLRVFSKDCYASVDFAGRRATALRKGPRLLSGEFDPTSVSPREVEDVSRSPLSGVVESVPLTILAHEPLKQEIAEFLAAVAEARDPAVTGAHGRQAMAVCEEILAAMR